MYQLYYLFRLDSQKATFYLLPWFEKKDKFVKLKILTSFILYFAPKSYLILRPFIISINAVASS